MATEKNPLTELITFMDQYKVDNTEEKWTHQTIIKYDPKYRFNVPIDQRDTFMDLYKKAIISGCDLHLREHKPLISPIII